MLLLEMILLLVVLVGMQLLLLIVSLLVVLMKLLFLLEMVLKTVGGDSTLFLFFLNSFCCYCTVAITIVPIVVIAEWMVWESLLVLNSLDNISLHDARIKPIWLFLFRLNQSVWEPHLIPSPPFTIDGDESPPLSCSSVNSSDCPCGFVQESLNNPKHANYLELCWKPSSGANFTENKKTLKILGNMETLQFGGISESQFLCIS